MTDQTDPDVPETAAGGEESPSKDPSDTVDQSEFARLLAGSEGVATVETGEIVTGSIVQIGDVDILVDVGGKGEASIARSELVSENGELSHKVGDAVEAIVVSTDGGLRLSRRAQPGGKGRDAVKQMLQDAYKARVPVQGKVTASIKGGYEVEVQGIRGFCPFSQIDVRRQEDPTLYFHKTFDFLIKEYNPRKRNLILSRRAIIEKEARKTERHLRDSIVVGSSHKGTVISLQDFGAFVDIGGGVQGLLHVSEISHARVAHPKDIISVGQEIDVRVIRIDKKKSKISLSRKPFEEDPWKGVAKRFKPGQVVAARVARVTEFGAFLELAPGVDGLLHISELAGRRDGGAPGQGDEVKVQVLKVDEGRKRVSLGLADESAAPGETVDMKQIRKGEVVTGKVERVEKFGVFVRIGPGRTGLVPNNEMGTPRGADHRRMFPPGTELTAEVIEADSAGRKIRLSVSKAEGREEREALARYRKDTTRASGSFSTLADAFAALKKSPQGADEGG